MTPASEMALRGLRDLTMIKWYVVALLAIVLYIYTFVPSPRLLAPAFSGRG